MRSNKETGSWCTIDFDSKVFRAELVHVGRGKFKIVNDNQDGAYKGKKIDASDILNCDPPSLQTTPSVELNESVFDGRS